MSEEKETQELEEVIEEMTPLEEVKEEKVEETAPAEETPEPVVEEVKEETVEETAPVEETPEPVVEEVKEETVEETAPAEETPEPVVEPKKEKKPAPKKKVEERPKVKVDPIKFDNEMQNLRIEKVVINIGVGEAGERLQKAEKVLTLLTKQKPVRTLSKTTNREFNVRKLMPIGCKVTLRDEPAVNFLKRAFWVKEYRIAGYSFDKEGNFSFGIPDYTSFEGEKYNPDIGIFGLDVCVTMKRAGKRVRIKKLKRGKIPARQRLNPDLVKNYLQSQFELEVVEE